MSLATLYLLLKAFHVIAVVTFVGGMITTLVTLRVARTGSDGQLIEAVIRWDQRVTTPALLLVWSLGLAMAIWTGWLAELWLQAKLGIVALLSGIHGITAGRLRRHSTGGPANPVVSPILILPLAGAAIILAMVKPG